MQTIETPQTTTSWRRSPHVIGIAPRSIYSDQTEAEAWAGAIEMARGRIHPTYIFGNRRILGVTQGQSPFSPNVRYVRLRKEARPRWTEREQLKADMLRMNWRDANDMIADLTAGKFGRTYFAKTPTTTAVASSWYDLWPTAGNPGPGSLANTAFTATTCDDTTTGSINHRGNVSTDTKHLLSKWATVTGNTPMLMLYDRVLVYDLCTFNASANKVLTNVNTALRYNTGAPGLLAMVPVNAVTGATAANLTQLQYTNQAGTTLQSMPTASTVTFIPSAAVSTTQLGARIIVPSTSGAVVTWGFALPLAQGDTGMRLVDNFTTSAANTGSFSIVLMKPISDLMIPLLGIPIEIDCVFQMSELERIYDGACLAFASFQPATTAYTLQGSIRYGWGSH